MEIMDGRDRAWSRWQKFAFRFVAVYFVIYVFPFPIDIFDTNYVMSQAYAKLWLSPVQWVGKYILQIPYDITTLPNGSGDTTFNYVQVFIYINLTLFISLLWSVLERKRVNYDILHFWFRTFIRYYLATAMLSYGFAKVFKTQFPFPDLNDLLSPVGEASPMGLVWRYMGYSYGYNIFIGGAEVLGGLLLLFRRTVTAGSLVLIGTMTNVAIINFCFDVPVKLYSTHLLLMAFFLLLPDMNRVIKFLFLNKPTESVNLSLPIQN